MVENMGQNVHILFAPDSQPSSKTIIISGGPLSYRYQLSFTIIKYGSHDSGGSEHPIGSHYFPGEVLFTYSLQAN